MTSPAGWPAAADFAASPSCVRAPTWPAGRSSDLSRHSMPQPALTFDLAVPPPALPSTSWPPLGQSGPPVPFAPRGGPGSAPTDSPPARLDLDPDMVVLDVSPSAVWPAMAGVCSPAALVLYDVRNDRYCLRRHGAIEYPGPVPGPAPCWCVQPPSPGMVCPYCAPGGGALARGPPSDSGYLEGLSASPVGPLDGGGRFLSPAGPMNGGGRFMVPSMAESPQWRWQQQRQAMQY